MFMLPRDQKYMYEWETRRSKGKWKHILLTSFIWGSLLPVVIECFNLAKDQRLSFSNLCLIVFDDDFLLTWVKYLAGVFCYALIMWYLAKRKYDSIRQRGKNGSDSMP
jgi:hypothetical protein